MKIILILFDKLNINSGAGKFDLNLKEKCGDIEIDGGVGALKIKLIYFLV